MVVRKYGDDHINKSLKQFDENTWLMGDSGYTLHRFPSLSPTATWNDEQENASYIIGKAPPGLTSTTSADSPHIELIYEGSDVSAIWAIGSNAICKVRYLEKGIYSESATLRWVENQKPSFEIPKAIHQILGTDRSFLFEQRIPGRTLDAAWPTLTEHWRRHYVNRIANICKEMAEWKGSDICCVDEEPIAETLLAEPSPYEYCDYLFYSVPEGCQALGMDCSDLVFYHTDLGPANIIVEDEPQSGKVGIIDFECAGFLPRGWIRTKFCLSSSMNLTNADNPHWFREEVQKVLGEMGFKEHVEAWARWRNIEV